jgi:phospholipase C
MPAQIKHLFVLMMENRSFDHMLGFMKAADYPIDGLDGTESNPDENGEPVRVTQDAQYTGDLTDDPHHHFPDVMQQIFGTQAPAAGAVPTMKGFVSDYQSVTGNAATAANIMKCFAPASLPVLTTLARQYAICDHWYASIPGPTLPNRLYAHCGTSQGGLEMSPDDYAGFYTVYEELAKQDVASCIFYHDWTAAMTFNGLLQHQSLFYDDFANFASLCAGNEADVPSYCFLEPRYNPEPGQVGGQYPANDQHPDNNVGAGEELIRDVYTAIRKNGALWQSSMMVIVYDEHGGIFDHEPPVKMPSPDGKSSVEPPFDFTLGGVRVPAVVVSPYIQAGTISSKTYDHTSLISTAMRLFAPGQWPSAALGARAEAALDLTSLLNLNMPPRMDVPDLATQAQPGVLAQIQAHAVPTKLSDLQKETLVQAASVNKKLPVGLQLKQRINSINDPVIANAYVKHVARAAIATRGSKKADSK